MLKRPRRNRRLGSIRSLVQETTLSVDDLVAPFFLIEGLNKKEPIHALPGVFRLSEDLIVKEAEKLHSNGIKAIALFPVIDQALKDPKGSQALNPIGLIPKILKTLKKELPSLCLITDVALDPFTDHGHDGILSSNGEILNDATVEILAQMAYLYAEAGSDFVAPSDMMDGRVKAIRSYLDANELENTGIISYAAKYASSLYSPFRDAVGSSLKEGDKKTYQMNPANIREALLESALDEEEGADILMIKPALFYLDVIAALRKRTNLPLSAYHVSGEYAMVMAAAEKGYLRACDVFFEALLSIKRSGADFIFTYAVNQVLDKLKHP